MGGVDRRSVKNFARNLRRIRSGIAGSVAPSSDREGARQREEEGKKLIDMHGIPIKKLPYIPPKKSRR